MVEQRIQIKQEFGLNARLSALISLSAQKFSSSISILKGKNEYNAKSIMALVMTSATQGDWLTVRAKGPDEQKAVNCVVWLLQIQNINEIELRLSGSDNGDNSTPLQTDSKSKMKQVKPIIIAIDDDPVMLDLYETLFGMSYGATVVCTTDATKALNFAFHEPPDLFITDLFHPGVDGFSLIQKLKGNSTTNLVPICVISGQANSKNSEIARSLGAALIISKPFETEKLLKQLNQFLKLKSE